MQSVIEIDVRSNGDGTYKAYISHEGSSGTQYDAIDAKTIGEYTADLIDTLEEAETGNSYLTNDEKCILVASNGTGIDYTQYNSYAEAYQAMKTAAEKMCKDGFSLDSARYSWLGKVDAYICPVDEGVTSTEDWVWNIITL